MRVHHELERQEYGRQELLTSTSVRTTTSTYDVLRAIKLLGTSTTGRGFDKQNDVFAITDLIILLQVSLSVAILKNVPSLN